VCSSPSCLEPRSLATGSDFCAYCDSLQQQQGQPETPSGYEQEYPPPYNSPQSQHQPRRRSRQGTPQSDPHDQSPGDDGATGDVYQPGPEDIDPSVTEIPRRHSLRELIPPNGRAGPHLIGRSRGGQPFEDTAAQITRGYVYGYVDGTIDAAYRGGKGTRRMAHEFEQDYENDTDPLRNLFRGMISSYGQGQGGRNPPRVGSGSHGQAQLGWE